MINSKDRYEVHLPVFEGPMDLLLQLIERERLDISTVSLTQVTDQFLAYVNQMESVKPDTLADFLVMAARLVLIKSRVLLPRPEAAEEEPEEDPGEALARQLREYKRFRDAARLLQSIEAAGQHAYVRVAPVPELDRRLDPSGVSMEELLEAVRQAFAALPPEPPVDNVVTPFRLTIHDQIQLIGELTAGNRTVPFRALLGRVQHRVEIIVTLLAVLELIKRRKVTAEQGGIFGEIVIKPVEGTTIEENGQADAAESSFI